MTMRIGIVAETMFFQRTGGLQRQANETSAALRHAGIDARIFCDGEDRIADFDLFHLFDVGPCGHRIIDTIHSAGVPWTSPALVDTADRATMPCGGVP